MFLTLVFNDSLIKDLFFAYFIFFKHYYYFIHIFINVFLNII